MSVTRLLLGITALAVAALLWRHAAVSNILLTSVDAIDGQIRGATPAPQPRALAVMGLGLVLLAGAGSWWRSRVSRNAPKR